MKEKVSALLDGALDDDASSRMLDSLKRDGALRREWESYCLIGDVLREEEGALSADFTLGVMNCLDEEPTILAPVPRDAGSQWVRHLMPIAASVVGVAAVGWVAMSFNGGGQDSSLRMASARAPAVAIAAPAESVARVAAEPSEREYLFAHQAMAPSAAMPGVAMYVRTVSDSRAAGER